MHDRGQYAGVRVARLPALRDRFREGGAGLRELVALEERNAQREERGTAPQGTLFREAGEGLTGQEGRGFEVPLVAYDMTAEYGRASPYIRPPGLLRRHPAVTQRRQRRRDLKIREADGRQKEGEQRARRDPFGGQRLQPLLQRALPALHPDRLVVRL